MYMLVLLLLLCMYVNLGNLKADTFVPAKGFSQLFFFPPSLFFFSFSCKVYGSLRGLGGM
jgi:hypothetical protein